MPSEILSVPLFPSSSRDKKGGEREREREREREMGFGRSASIDGGVSCGKDVGGHGSVNPAYAKFGRSVV